VGKELFSKGVVVREDGQRWRRRIKEHGTQGDPLIWGEA
jgi:hypothetical protein